MSGARDGDEAAATDIGRLSVLEIAMAAAAAKQNYEEAARLRNAIQVARQAGLDAVDAGLAGRSDEADADFSGLDRQQPGKMGIGSQVPRRTPPADWTPPRKPDPMTAGHRRGGRRKG